MSQEDVWGDLSKWGSISMCLTGITLYGIDNDTGDTYMMTLSWGEVFEFCKKNGKKMTLPEAMKQYQKGVQKFMEGGSGPLEE